MKLNDSDSKSVFISYSHKDAKYLDDLKRHTAPFKHKIDFWDDSLIQTGELWKDKINAALHNAHVAILMLSPNFLGSIFITEIEIPTLLLNAEKRGVKIVIVYLSHCAIQYFPELTRYQFINNLENPVSSFWHDEAKRDELWVKVVHKVMGFLSPAGNEIIFLRDKTESKGLTKQIESVFEPADLKTNVILNKETQIDPLMKEVIRDEEANQTILYTNATFSARMPVELLSKIKGFMKVVDVFLDKKKICTIPPNKDAFNATVPVGRTTLLAVFSHNGKIYSAKKEVYITQKMDYEFIINIYKVSGGIELLVSIG